MVCHKYSQRGAKVSLSRRIGSSCGFGFCHFPSRYRKLHFGSYKSHNTAISIQLFAVSSRRIVCCGRARKLTYEFCCRSDELVEPQSSILAKLCVYCIFSTLEYNNSNPYRGNSRKRVRHDLDADELDVHGVSANKLLRLNETGENVPIFSSQSPQTQGSSNGKKSFVLRDPLLTALNNLFIVFAYLAGRDGEVSQQTHFILQFLRLTVQCGKERTRIVLQGMPQTLVRCICI